MQALNMITKLHFALCEDESDVGCTIYNATVDAFIETDGTGLWGCEKGRKVHVTGITVIDESDEEGNEHRSVNVQHDSEWNIYTDKGFAKGMSELLGFEVSFTEQGMQEDNFASMEAN